MKKKFNVGRLMRAIAFATLITTLLTLCIVGVFARYTSTMTGTLSLRVAKWDVYVSSVEKPKYDLIDKDGQKTAEYTFDVTSKSEVALSYDVVLTMPEVIPNGLTFTILDVNGNDVSPSISGNGLIYTFSNVGAFTADGGTNRHTLKITSDFTHNSIRLEGIKVEVIAEQTN